MTICPVQQWGIGDVIFEMTLVRAFELPVTWVVLPQFVDGLQRAYPDINFTTDKPIGYDSERREDHTVGENRFLPARWADVMMNVPYHMCMRAKYDLYQLPWQSWRTNAMWSRDVPRETALRAYLGIANGERYNLINKHFRSNGSGIAAISVDNGLRNVYMQSIDGFSLFDWGGIIERATTIHTVSTAILYMLELLEIPETHLYVRKPDEVDFRNVEYLFTKKYNLHL